MNSSISVIIPVRNEESKICTCLEAILCQSVLPIEIIVVDGHSTDNTVANAKKYPINLFFEEYHTRAGANNIGIENARGELIAFTDADCIPDKNWLQNLIKEFNEEIVGVGGRVINIGYGIWENSINFVYNTFLGSANSVQGRIFENKKFVSSISGSNSIYRKRDLIKVGKFNVYLKTAEDTELNKRLLALGKLLYTPHAIIFHKHQRGLSDFCKRMYQYGQGRANVNTLNFQIVPPILILFLVLSLIVSPIIFVAFFILYLFLIFIMGIHGVVVKRDLRFLITIPIVYLIEHSAYALGFWRGICEKFLRIIRGILLENMHCWY